MNPATLPLNLRSAIREALPVLRGWGGKEERPYRMAELIVRQRPVTVVEIGVFGGQSLIPQAMALKVLGSGRIYGIDPFDIDVIAKELSQTDNPPQWWVKQNMNVVREDTLRAIKDFGLGRQVVMILAQSRDCSTLFQEIDILHIDGAHSENGVMNDVNLYAKRVRRGGYIWMDDTHFPSLDKALRELEYFCDMIQDYGSYCLYRVK